jgi:hypothetical protein
MLEMVANLLIQALAHGAKLLAGALGNLLVSGKR